MSLVFLTAMRCKDERMKVNYYKITLLTNVELKTLLICRICPFESFEIVFLRNVYAGRSFGPRVQSNFWAKIPWHDSLKTDNSQNLWVSHVFAIASYIYITYCIYGIISLKLRDSIKLEVWEMPWCKLLIMHCRVRGSKKSNTKYWMLLSGNWTPYPVITPLKMEWIDWTLKSFESPRLGKEAH